MDHIILIWIFSCVLAWAFTGSSTSMGETIFPKEYRIFIRILALIFSLTAICTTIYLSPIFTVAIIAVGFQGAAGGAALSFILWTFIHLSGAVYTVASVGTKLATNTI